MLDLVAAQFNATTPENCLKRAAVLPYEDRYNFEPADIYVEWGEFVIMTGPNSIELQSVMLMLV